MTRPLRLAAPLVFFFAATAAQAHNLAETDGLWHGSFSLGGSSASGNTSASALSLNAEASRSSEVDKISAALLANHATGRADGVRTRTAELLRGNARYDFNLGDTVFAFGGAEAEANRPGGIRRRNGLNAGIGWKLVLQENHSLDVFAGVGHLDTRYTDGSARRGAELLFGEESVHRFGNDSSLRQKLVLYPAASELGARASFDTTLATAITGGWTFNAGLAWRYADKVAPGLKKRDSLLTFGVGYKF